MRRNNDDANVENIVVMMREGSSVTQSNEREESATRVDKRRNVTTKSSIESLPLILSDERSAFFHRNAHKESSSGQSRPKKADAREEKPQRGFSRLVPIARASREGRVVAIGWLARSAM